MKHHKKPTQRQVEIGLDYLVTKIISTIDVDKRSVMLESLKKAYYIYQGAGYDVEKFRGIYEELR